MTIFVAREEAFPVFFLFNVFIFRPADQDFRSNSRPVFVKKGKAIFAVSRAYFMESTSAFPGFQTDFPRKIHLECNEYD